MATKSMGMPAPAMVYPAQDAGQQVRTNCQAQPQQGQMQPPQQPPQQQTNVDQNMNRSEPSNGPTPYELLFLNLESHSSIMLCTLAKDVIREIINQTSDLFKTVKNIQLPLQTAVPPAQLGASLKQYLDKQERVQKSILALFNKLSLIIDIVDRRYKSRVPTNIVPKDLIPFENEPNKVLDEIKIKRNENDQLKRLMSEKEYLQTVLSNKRNEMERRMNFAVKTTCLSNPTSKIC